MYFAWQWSVCTQVWNSAITLHCTWVSVFFIRLCTSGPPRQPRMPRIGPCQVLAATLTLSQPGGSRLCPPYTGVLGWLKFAVAALIFTRCRVPQRVLGYGITCLGINTEFKLCFKTNIFSNMHDHKYLFMRKVWEKSIASLQHLTQKVKKFKHKRFWPHCCVWVVSDL